MGRPLDSSQGYDFNPAARPPDLPMPGDQPGGNDRGGVRPEAFDGKRMGDQMHNARTRAAALPDDHDAVMNATGVNFNTNAPTARPAAPGPRPRVRVEHPILEKLRQDLGIDAIATYEVKIGEHIWTLRTLTSGEVAVASRLADQVSNGVTEHAIIYQSALAAHSVVAIDGEPTHEVFGVDVPPGTLSDPFRPPRAVRAVAAQRLYEFITEESRTQLSQRLYDAYLDKADHAGAVATYLDDPTNQRVRYRCAEEMCNDEALLVPRRVPGAEQPVIPVCRWHATPMEVVGEEAPGPLA
jgi:hypothetical protein